MLKNKFPPENCYVNKYLYIYIYLLVICFPMNQLLWNIIYWMIIKQYVLCTKTFELLNQASDIRVWNFVEQIYLGTNPAAHFVNARARLASLSKKKPALAAATTRAPLALPATQASMNSWFNIIICISCCLFFVIKFVQQFSTQNFDNRFLENWQMDDFVMNFFKMLFIKFEYILYLLKMNCL